MKKIISIFIIFLAFLSLAVKADEMPVEQSFVYIFHLYYDNGDILSDRDFKVKYEILAEEFKAEGIASKEAFKGDVVSNTDKILTNFTFDPTKGNLSFKGKFKTRAPYFADAKNVNFYNPNGQKLLTIDVSDSSFCNNDMVCDEDRGEAYTNCPNDCKDTTLVGPSGGDRPTSVNSSWTRFILPYTIIGFLSLSVLILIIKFVRKIKSNNPGSPTTPV